MDPKLHQNRSRDPRHATLSGLTHDRFGLFPVRSPLLRKSLLFSLPEVTKMFQFTSLASNTYVFSEGSAGIILRGFPIQKTPDQSLFSNSPELIAAFHVFHRLLTPRHPPTALCSLATNLYLFSSLIQQAEETFTLNWLDLGISRLSKNVPLRWRIGYRKAEYFLTIPDPKSMRKWWRIAGSNR